MSLLEFVYILHYIMITGYFTMCLDQFFSEWDAVESMHPWGVQFFTPLFRVFNVPPGLCEEVDDRLFLDLMIQVHPNIRRIKVEGRHSQALFWVHVELRCPFAVVSFQRLPNTPMERSLVVAATPGLLVACILAFHHWVVSSKAYCRRICWGQSRSGMVVGRRAGVRKG